MPNTPFSTYLDQHERYVKRSSGGARIKFGYTDLSGLDARRRLLTEAHFVGCNLSDARFTQSKLNFATFFNSGLLRADLTYCTLHRADLRGTALWGAKLYGADLTGADLRQAALVLGKPGAAFNQQVLPWHSEKIRPGLVTFEEGSLRGANLTQAKLDGAVFRGANLTGASVAGASFQGANFDGAVISNVDFSQAETDGASFDGALGAPSAEAAANASSMKARIASAERWAKSSGSEGERLVLDGADLRVIKTGLKNRIIPGASLRDCIAVGVDFSGAVLIGASFDDADLRDANFTGADLRGVRFRNCRLSQASFYKADLRPMVRANGDQRAVSFSGAQAARLEATDAKLEHEAQLSWVQAGRADEAPDTFEI